jgi:hypothetical protein
MLTTAQVNHPIEYSSGTRYGGAYTGKWMLFPAARTAVQPVRDRHGTAAPEPGSPAASRWRRVPGGRHSGRPAPWMKTLASATASRLEAAYGRSLTYWPSSNPSPDGPLRLLTSSIGSTSSSSEAVQRSCAASGKNTCAVPADTSNACTRAGCLCTSLLTGWPCYTHIVSINPRNGACSAFRRGCWIFHRGCGLGSCRHYARVLLAVGLQNQDCLSSQKKLGQLPPE